MRTLLTCAVTMTASVAMATTYYLNTGSDPSHENYRTPSCWSDADGNLANAMKSSDTYVVRSGYCLKLSGDTVFTGRLVLGEVGGTSGSADNYAYDLSAFSCPDGVELAKGIIYGNIVSDDRCANVDGPMTVTSVLDDPFVIYNCYPNLSAYYVKGSLSGDESAALQLGKDNVRNDVRLTGDLSAYRGTFVVASAATLRLNATLGAIAGIRLEDAASLDPVSPLLTVTARSVSASGNATVFVHGGEEGNSTLVATEAYAVTGTLSFVLDASLLPAGDSDRRVVLLAAPSSVALDAKSFAVSTVGSVKGEVSDPVVENASGWNELVVYVHSTAKVFDVSSVAELQSALGQAEGMDIIRLAPGTYDLSAVVGETETVEYGGASREVVNHIVLDQPLRIRSAGGHWDDSVVFRTTTGGRAIRVLNGVAAEISGVTFEGFSGGDWSGGDTTDRTSAGGAVRFDGDWTADGSRSARLTNCVIRSCSASHAGAVCGGLAVDCLVTNCSASVAGATYKTRLVDCELSDNSCSSYYGCAQDPCGAVGCRFFGNRTPSYSAALAISENNDWTVSNCLFRVNVCGGNIGGAIGIENISRCGRIVGCEFIGNVNEASGIGGTIGAVRCQMPIDLVDCVFSCNTNLNFSWDGSVVCVSEDIGDVCFLRAVGCRFEGNVASSYCRGGAVTEGVYSNCVFDTCLAREGGAAFIRSGRKGRFVACTFAHNAAEGNGGAVSCADADAAEFEGCVFEGNKALSGAGSASFGGTFTNCTFRANNAKYGAVYGAKATGCWFFDNKTDGSGLCSADAVRSELTNCELHGGGIWFCSLLNCRILEVQTGDAATQPYCVFHGANWATNCLVARCTGSWGVFYRQLDDFSSCGPLAPADGADVVSEFVNCTFADNTYGGYRLLCTDSPSGSYRINFVNCIFNGNLQGGDSNDFSLYWKFSADAVSLENCLYNTSYSDREFVDRGGLVVGRDAGFAKEGSPTIDCYCYYRLRKGSPARNAGKDIDWWDGATDLEGNPRVSGSHVDMGCYEYQQVDSGFMLYLR